MNTYQEMERGRQRQLNAVYNASKTNAQAQRQGADSANAALKAEAAKARARRAARQQDPNAGFQKVQGQKTQTTGQLRGPGVQIIRDDDDE